MMTDLPPTPPAPTLCVGRWVSWPRLSIDRAFLTDWHYGEPAEQYRQYTFPNGWSVRVVLHESCFGHVVDRACRHVYRVQGLTLGHDEASLTAELLRVTALRNLAERV